MCEKLSRKVADNLIEDFHQSTNQINKGKTEENSTTNTTINIFRKVDKFSSINKPKSKLCNWINFHQSTNHWRRSRFWKMSTINNPYPWGHRNTRIFQENRTKINQKGIFSLFLQFILVNFGFFFLLGKIIFKLEKF